MSMIHCDGCSRLIDTDADPGAYDSAHDLWMCETCREPWEREDVQEDDRPVSNHEMSLDEFADDPRRGQGEKR